MNKGLGNNVHLFESKVTLLHYIIGTKDFAKENLQRDSEIFNKPRKVCGFEYYNFAYTYIVSYWNEIPWNLLLDLKEMRTIHGWLFWIMNKNKQNYFVEFSR